MTAPSPSQQPALSIEIRPIRAEDWELTRCVRYAALADAPDAFASTLDEELALPEAKWRERAESNAAGRESAGYLALRDGVPCGMVVGVLSAGDQVELNALWVAENVRRRGTARALVQAVCVWARSRGAARVSLQVTTSSHAAIALYRGIGFEPEGTPDATCGSRRAPAIRMHKRLDA